MIFLVMSWNAKTKKSCCNSTTKINPIATKKQNLGLVSWKIVNKQLYNLDPRSKCKQNTKGFHAYVFLAKYLLNYLTT